MMNRLKWPVQPGWRQALRPVLPGLLIILVLACVVPFVLVPLMPTVGDVTIAIFLGLLVGNLLPDMTRLNPGVGFAEKRLLPVAIALLGVELQLAMLLSSGAVTIVVIVATVGIALLTSLLLGPLFGFSRRFSLLMGAGNGICGTAAVAAVSTVIHADDEDTGIALSVVGLLGTIGIVIMPLLAQAVSLSIVQSGMLVGGTLQAVGQVVAAGYALSAPSGSVSMIVKMGRVLMLGPVVVVISSIINRREKVKPGARIQIPLFIVGFFVSSVLASSGVISPLVPGIRTLGKFLLVMATVGIGMHIQLRSLYRSGPRAVLFGVTIWAVQIAAVLAIVVIAQV